MDKQTQQPDLPQFSVQSLLTRKKNGRIYGPMAPVEVAKIIVKTMDAKISGLCRIIFEDSEYFNTYEGSSLTGYDFLASRTKYENDDLIMTFIDMGNKNMPVSMSFQSDRKVAIAPIYNTNKFEKALTIEQLQKLSDFLLYNKDDLFKVKEEN